MKKVIISLVLLGAFLIQTACSNRSVEVCKVKDSTAYENKNTISKEINEARSNKKLDAKDIGKDIYELVPEGWEVLGAVDGELKLVEGDLNQDKILDVVAVIQRVDKFEEAAPRALLIAFGREEKTYNLSIIAEKAILKADEGGVWGDPLESISIERGSVLITFYGGSNWRWYKKYRFRYQDNGWYLIGATLGSYFNGNTIIENADEEDYNLLTGDYIIKKIDNNGKQIIEKGNRGKKALVNLKDFIAGSEEIQF